MTFGVRILLLEDRDIFTETRICKVFYKVDSIIYIIILLIYY